MIGPIPELAEALSVHHDNFDVGVLDINLRDGSVYPLADELMRIGKPFDGDDTIATALGVCSDGKSLGLEA